MKYSEMSESQKAAYRDILAIIVNVRSQEAQKYTYEGYRLLVIGNGAGIIILATFMGNMVGKVSAISVLMVPLFLFFLGIILAALTYIPLIAVANNGAVHVMNRVNDFFLDKIDIEQVEGYGLSHRG